MQDGVDLPLASDLAECLDASRYQRLPEDWWVAVTDVVKSRQAIAAGRYKAVNMAGVAAISSVMNGTGRQDLPYVFGGDGAAIAGPASEQEAVAEALAATCRWVAEELDLELRAAIVTHREIIDAGHHLSAIRVRVSDALSNFAFAGGGVTFAESRMKSGDVRRLDPAPPGTAPDLTGLSCRWTPVRPRDGVVVSLIAEAMAGSDSEAEILFGKILEFAHGLENDGHPVPVAGPGFTWPPEGLELEARATRGGAPLAARKRRLFFETLIAWVLDKTKIPIGPFSPVRYRNYTARNTDDRKYQDGLKMTLSLTPEQRHDLETLLEKGRLSGAIRYGLSLQDSAVLTCFVPSIMSDDHMHFLDGAGGGYAEAASNMRG
ncbi:MAG: DUF3095 domain-containing protein [Pseudomonadota bacterium]